MGYGTCGVEVLTVESRLGTDGTIKRAVALATGLTRNELADIIDTITEILHDDTFWPDDIFDL
jgi:hypothetical protein